MSARKTDVPQGDVPWKVRMRVCVWYSQLLGTTAANMAHDFQHIFGPDAIKAAAIRSLFRQFQDGRQEMRDLKRSGRPSIKTAPTKVQEVKYAVTTQPRMTISRLALCTGLNYTTTQRILKRKLKLRKRSCKLVPHELTDVQKANRVSMSVNFLQNCECKGWLERVITADESWFHTCNPNPKCDNMVWSVPGSDRLQVARRPMNTEKTMAIPFFDWRGLIYCHWVMNGAVTGAEYQRALRNLCAHIRLKRPHMWRRRRALTFLLHDNNASPHTCQPTVHLEQMTNFKRILHPPYSPDLSPCDFFLFPTVKRALCGRNFSNVYELMAEVDRLMGAIPSWRWRQCFRDWKWHTLQCIDHDGNYFEGIKIPPPVV